MDYKLDNDANTQQIDIDKKMIGILAVFAGLGTCLIITIIIASSTLSALRAYGTMQTHWTGARKEASYQLVNFIETKDPHYRSKFDSSLQFINTASSVLNELVREDTEKQFVRDNLLEIYTAPEDVDIMITAFERFHDFGDFSESVQIWSESEKIINNMKKLQADVEDLISSGQLTNEEQQEKVQQVQEYELQLTQYQFQLANTLASGTRLLTGIIIWGSVSLGVLMLLIGGFLSVRFVKGVKNWERTIKKSEERFRSLFEQSPHAVFSLDKNGNLLKANKEFEMITGYSFEEMEGLSVEPFFDPSQIENVQKSFTESVQGVPKTFETSGIRKKGKRIHIEVTHVPIYVEGEVTGVYGIMHDITERKQAEKKITEQLEEKNHLLSEVHDRVKNNLALMSSLIQLEHEFSDLQDDSYMESTVSRIHSMALVHEQLYHNHTFSSIRMDKYVTELSKSIQNKSNFNSGNFNIELNTKPVTLSMRQAIPIGLILNELLVNTFKYAFVGREKGNVEIELHQAGTKISLKVSDDGVGLPEDFKIEDQTTMGMKLITILCKQLNASLEFDTSNGTTFTIHFMTNNMNGNN